MADLRPIEQRLCVWRGLAAHSLEVLRLARLERGYVARSNVLTADMEPRAVEYELRLDGSWRSESLEIRIIARDREALRVERAGETSWRLAGKPAPDLEGCDEVDLSITPFCNTLALRRFGPPPGGAGELTALYIEFPQLVPRPSRQRYERVGMYEFRYVDLGAHAGFEALLTVDDDGLVTEYEGLFERVAA